jgi:hypothetical protein
MSESTHLNYQSITRNSLTPIRGYFWTKDEDPQLVREATQEELQGPIPEDYELRFTPGVFLFGYDDDPRVVVVHTVQPWEVEGFTDTLANHDNGAAFTGFTINTRADLNRFISSLTELRDGLFPLPKPEVPAAFKKSE